MKTFKRLFVGFFLLLTLFSAGTGWGQVSSASLVGTWGVQGLDYENGRGWYTEASKITFNSDGTTGIMEYKFNENGVFDSVTESFTYTVVPIGDGGFFALNVSFTEETEDIRFALSDNGTMIITNGTVDTDEVWLNILIKIDTTRQYTNADLTGEAYTIGYEHDAQGGQKGYYRASSGISCSDGNGNLSFTAGTLNGDGVLQDYSGDTIPYTVNSDGSVNIDDITGYLSGNGLCIFSNPAATDNWMNVFAMAKGDRTYSTADLAGTWAFTGFGDYEGTVFYAVTGTITCDSAGNCTCSSKVQQSDGSVRYVSDSETLSVASDGSFGSSLPGAIPYAGAIGNDGNTLIMNGSFDPDNLNYRIITVAVRCSACCSTDVGISGDITTQDGTPVCAMVLANGQYMFSCDPTGKYNLSVPLDEYGKITLFAFADGFAPFRHIFTPEGATNNIDIIMSPAPPDSPQMTLTCQIDTAEKPGWVRISGQARAKDGGTPLCAMVLANGKYMFSNAGDGGYEMEVPLNEYGQVTLFGFADGFQPFKTVLAAHGGSL